MRDDESTPGPGQHPNEDRAGGAEDKTVPVSRKTDDVRVCPSCGTRQRPVLVRNTTNAVCTTCGTPVPP